MFCPKCGNQIFEGLKFCGRCGADLNQTQPAETAIIAPPISQATTATPSAGKGGKKILWILLSLVALGIIFAIIGVKGGPDSAKNVKIIINWLLGIAFGIDVLAIPGGIIAGIIYLSKANHEQGPMNIRYKHTAIWWFIGPIATLFFIIFYYVVLNVIFNLA